MKIYYRDGKTEMDILPSDLPYWQSQGWMATKTAASAAPPAGQPSQSAQAAAPAQAQMDAATSAKFMQAYGRTPNATDLANWRYDAATVNRQLDAAIAAKAKAVPSAQTVPAATAAAPAAAGRKFYRIGADIYEAGTDRRIGPTEWGRDWSGKATEVSAPAVSAASAAPAVQAQQPATNAFADSFVAAYDQMEKNGDLEGMSEAQKDVAVLQEIGVTAGTADEKELAKQYLAKAKELADPYYKSMVNVALDELSRTLTSSAQDLIYKKNQIDAKIGELQSDLTYSREQLTLDEQTEMANQLREYETARDSLDLQMQEAGLAFSSPRQAAESKLTSQQSETAQALTRKYAASRREAELSALRAQGQLEQERQLAERTAQESAVQAARATEAKVGSSNLPSAIAGQPLGALGGVSGSIEDQRKSAILDLERIIAGRGGEVPTY